MAVGVEGLHRDTMTDDIFYHGLRHDVLHHRYESMSEGIYSTGELSFLLELDPLISHGRLVSLGSVTGTEDPLGSEVLILIPLDSLQKDAPGI